jgi:uncharacterized RDD family membrane protein YckC
MPPPPPPANRAFIIKGDDGEEYGPVDLDELRQWVRENRAGLGIVVRLDEPGALWQPWQYFPELVALLAEAQSVGGVPGYPALVLAPMGRRMAAFAIDLILAYILLTPIVLVTWIALFPDAFIHLQVALQLLMLNGQQMQYTSPLAVQDTMELIFTAGITFYMAGFHAAHGRTPAQSVLRLRVVDQDGQKPAPVKALLRSLVLSFSVCLFFFPLAYAFFNPQRRAIHDLLTGTYVVEE